MEKGASGTTKMGAVVSSLTRVFYLTRKELTSLFNSPIAYIVIIFFLSFSAMWLFVVQQFLLRDVADLRPYFAILPSLFIVIIPALTMRSWAEERKLGTDEFLLTLPYYEFEVIFSKFLAVRLMIYVILGLTFPVPLLVSPLGDFEFGQIVGQYVGVWLFTVPVIAIGIFFSVISTNQISAFILSVVVLLALSLVNQIAVFLSPPPVLSNVLEYLSLSRHFRSFEIGLIDTRDSAYYLTLAWFFLYLSLKVVMRRKK